MGNLPSTAIGGRLGGHSRLWSSKERPGRGGGRVGRRDYANCSASVEPVSAVTEDLPPWQSWVISSK